MKSKIFMKLLGLFLLLLVFQAAAMEFVVIPFIARRVLEVPPGGTNLYLGNEILWAGLIALAVALTLAVWVASRITTRLDRIVAFARRIAAGEPNARLDYDVEDPLSSIEAALDQAAQRLSQSIAEIESHRQELAAMLDSLQEAVVAITSEGLVRWSNAAMERIAGTQIRTGLSLVHSVQDPELLSCVKAALEKREVLLWACQHAGPRPHF